MIACSTRGLRSVDGGWVIVGPRAAAYSIDVGRQQTDCNGEPMALASSRRLGDCLDLADAADFWAEHRPNAARAGLPGGAIFRLDRLSAGGRGLGHRCGVVLEPELVEIKRPRGGRRGQDRLLVALQALPERRGEIDDAGRPD